MWLLSSLEISFIVFIIFMFILKLYSTSMCFTKIFKMVENNGTVNSTKYARKSRKSVLTGCYIRVLNF